MGPLDGPRIAAIKETLAKLQLRRFDAKMPRSMQRDPEEYARRMSRRAAVCVSLCNVDNEASVLLTLRSAVVGTHAGQVSFPGGHIDEEETPETAALRELAEETDLTAEPLGRWHDVRAVTGTMVTPVVCLVSPSLTPMRVKQAAEVSVEVEQTFSLPIQAFARPEVRTVEELKSRWTMPRFQVPDDPHPPIWGLTAFIIDGVMRDVLVPALGLGEYPPLEDSLPRQPSERL